MHLYIVFLKLFPESLIIKSFVLIIGVVCGLAGCGVIVVAAGSETWTVILFIRSSHLQLLLQTDIFAIYRFLT